MFKEVYDPITALNQVAPSAGSSGMSTTDIMNPMWSRFLEALKDKKVMMQKGSGQKLGSDPELEKQRAMQGLLGIGRGFAPQGGE